MAASSGRVPFNSKMKPKLGLRAWMERVLDECDRVAGGLQPDPVHDLRVALRRCRSLADGMMALDSDSSWKQMKKAGKKLFRALGDLRDLHVLQEWVEKLSDAADPVAVKLLDHIHGREAECTYRAMQELEQFDRKQWRQWSKSLPRRAARVRPDSVPLRHLALERLVEAQGFHRRAMHTRSAVALHELRIGIKRFRYSIENFVPSLHPAWANDLKQLQDLLGEIHDFDVLWQTATQISAFPDSESEHRWREMLTQERSKRVDAYREKMKGKHSLWQIWRAALPSGAGLRLAALARLRVWASYLDPDSTHSQNVAKLSLLIYDGLRTTGLLADGANSDPRSVLHAAALLHDVGKASGQKSHQKESFRMIGKLEAPLGWTARQLELAAVVARYHRGGLPRPRAKVLQSLNLAERRMAVQLSGVLRLANAIEAAGAEPRVQLTLEDRTIVLQAAGYSPLDRSAEQVAAARHLLEVALHRPVLVRSLRRERSRARKQNRSGADRGSPPRA